MDLNQLYFDHQVLLIRAHGAGQRKDRHHFETGARALAGRIADVQERTGAEAARWWKAQSVRPGAAMSAAVTARGFAS